VQVEDETVSDRGCHGEGMRMLSTGIERFLIFFSWFWLLRQGDSVYPVRQVQFL